MEGVLGLLFLALLVVFLVMRKVAIRACSQSYELPPLNQQTEKSMADYIREAHALNPDTGPIPEPMDLVSEEVQSERSSQYPKRDRTIQVQSNRKPEVKRGPRGGRYTEDRTKDGRPYRRYF